MRRGSCQAGEEIDSPVVLIHVSRSLGPQVLSSALGVLAVASVGISRSFLPNGKRADPLRITALIELHIVGELLTSFSAFALLVRVQAHTNIEHMLAFHPSFPTAFRANLADRRRGNF